MDDDPRRVDDRPRLNPPHPPQTHDDLTHNLLKRSHLLPVQSPDSRLLHALPHRFHQQIMAELARKPLQRLRGKRPLNAGKISKRRTHLNQHILAHPRPTPSRSPSPCRRVEHPISSRHLIRHSRPHSVIPATSSVIPAPHSRHSRPPLSSFPRRRESIFSHAIPVGADLKPALPSLLPSPSTLPSFRRKPESSLPAHPNQPHPAHPELVEGPVEGSSRPPLTPSSPTPTVIPVTPFRHSRAGGNPSSPFSLEGEG